MLRDKIIRERTPWNNLKIQGKSLQHYPPKTSNVTVGEGIEISHGKLPLMPEKSAFVFHHNFYPKHEVDLEDAEIASKMKQKLTDLQKKYDNTISNCNIVKLAQLPTNRFGTHKLYAQRIVSKHRHMCNTT